MTTLKNEIDAIFRAYDIRGIVDESLTVDLVYNIGRALGTEATKFGCATIVVGRDGRVSSPQLAKALIDGIITTGVNALDIGLVPTPALYFAAYHTQGKSGVMITGSHNPANYNGLKMVINGETLSDHRIQDLKHCIQEHRYHIANTGKVEHNTELVESYISAICDDVKLAKPLKIALDCGNGAASELAPDLFKRLGCEVIELFCEIDGTFPNHHPDPSKPENVADLIQAVKQNNADVGIAFDGDADRLGVIDSNGNIIWADRQMMAFAKDVLNEKPSQKIVYDVKCSRHLTTQIAQFGGEPVMWKTGHSFMKNKLKETGAALAGEMSGHIFFNDRWFGFDDALYSAARMLAILARDTRDSASVFTDFPNSVNTPELNVSLKEGESADFMRQLIEKANFPDANLITIDGLRVEFSNSWGLVRASNTTPSLVIRFEADTQEALQHIQTQFRELMIAVKSDIKLPF